MIWIIISLVVFHIVCAAVVLRMLQRIDRYLTSLEKPETLAIRCIHCGAMIKIDFKCCPVCGGSQFEESAAQILKDFVIGYLTFSNERKRTVRK